MAESKKGKYVPIYLEWLDVTQDLTAEEKGNLIDAIISYAKEEEYEHLLTGATKIAFRFFKGQVDRNKDISDKRSRAGSNKPEQAGTNDNKPEQTGTKLPKEKDKEKDKDKEKEYFKPPTVEEVAAYCRERNNGIDAEYFVDYQTARNWILSNGKKCKDWRATVRTWEKNGYNNRASPKKVNAQDYTQRDYSNEQDEAMRRMIAGVNANAG